jgi:glutamyl-tRNA reductase
VLVIGAGEMGEGVARSLVSRGIADVCVANRTAARAAEIARRIGGRAVSLDQLDEQLIDADVLVASTASQHVLVERSAVEHVMAHRPDRPLLVVDVALPRDVDPGVREVDGVTLLDLDDLKDFAQRSAELRRREIGKVREILSAELERYRLERAAREVAPLVTSLRTFGEDVRASELARFQAKLAALEPSEREAVEAVTRGIVNKLLHEPTVRVKDAAGTGRGDYLGDALAALFDLPDPGQD